MAADDLFLRFLRAAPSLIHNAWEWEKEEQLHIHHQSTREMTLWEEWMVFTACPDLVVSADKVKSYFHSYSERYGKLGRVLRAGIGSNIAVEMVLVVDCESF